MMRFNKLIGADLQNFKLLFSTFILGLMQLDLIELWEKDICYISPVLTTLDTVRYTKHTCTLAKFHIMYQIHEIFASDIQPQYIGYLYI